MVRVVAGGTSIALPLCRETPVSRKTVPMIDVVFPNRQICMSCSIYYFVVETLAKNAQVITFAFKISVNMTSQVYIYNIYIGIYIYMYIPTVYICIYTFRAYKIYNVEMEHAYVTANLRN